MVDKGKSECLRLNDGRLMPIIGLGTSKAHDQDIERAVTSAIDAGYRLIDCAIFYHNEEAVGRAIRAKIDDGTVSRDQLFITGKLWRSFNRNAHMDECLNESLRRLNLKYFDLYLMHYPNALAYGGLDDFVPRDSQGRIRIDEECDYVTVWRNMQRFKGDGRARSLGVSNFNAFQLNRLMTETSLPPAVNQIEFHPYLTQTKLLNFCASRGIAVTAYCCVGASDRATFTSPNTGNTDAEDNFLFLLRDPVLQGIGEKYGKSPAQIALRFCIDSNVAAVPKSVTPRYIAQNIDVFSFRLDETDMDQLLALNRNHRYLPALIDRHHKYHAFRDNYTE